MIKTFGEAAFSIILATSGLSPFLLGDWPVAPSSHESTAVEAKDVPVADPDAVAPVSASAGIPDLYREVSKERIAQEMFNEKVQEFATDLRGAFNINPTRAKNFSEWILVAVESTSIPKEVMAVLVVSESSFQYKLTSPVGAVGPAQVRPEFWSEKCGSGDLEHDPKFNIQCGSIALSEYLQDYCDGDMTCALQTYNVGPGNMKLKKYEGAKQRYISKINRNMARLTNRTMLASQ